jgi:hypothetical protein
VITTRAETTTAVHFYSTGEPMYRSIFYTLLITSFLLVESYHVQAGVQKDRTKWRHLDERLLTSSIVAALERWHTDSLGCLNLRTTSDSDSLIAIFGLDNASSDSVVMVMGTPNHIFKGEYITNDYSEIEATIYSYYFHTNCKGDLLQPESFITFVISNQTNRVVERTGGVH